MKIKMANRYDFGWSDPRAASSQYHPDSFKLNQRRNTGLEQVPTETLRTLWLARFNGRAAPMKQIYAESAEEFADVAQELYDRKQVRYEEHYSSDKSETNHYFVLEKEDGNN